MSEVTVNHPTPGQRETGQKKDGLQTSLHADEKRRGFTSALSRALKVVELNGIEPMTS